MVPGMHWLVKISDEMSEEGQRHQPFTGGHASVRQQSGGTLGLRRHAIAVLAGGPEVERLAHIDVLVVPVIGIAESVTQRLDAVGPDAGLFQGRHRAAGRFE